MAYEERRCVGCKNSHGAAAWYARKVKGTTEYVCGEKYRSLKDRVGWRQVFPAHDD
jgi:hypothetical protein